jgi:sporulation protein YlmC with PRC-barrel domain
VIGTNVKDPSGHKIGAIEDVMLDKESNSIMFAVVGFGGPLGVAEKYYKEPRYWESAD